ncbi:hypothetical protein CSV67_15080 [Sporosarcina sp. P2]|nr:hypothetical protein CSV67_15080 [Sporosarcina sp. P2]
MLTMKLDHLIYFTQDDPHSIVMELRAKGNRAAVLGQHESFGTANALLYADNVYNEWLTVEDEDKVRIAATDLPLIAQYFHGQQTGDGWQ